MARQLITGAFLAMVLAAGMPGTVAQEISALKDHDTDRPIDITADRLEVKQKENQAIFKGAVEAVQGDLKLTSAELIVYYETTDGATNPTISRLDATGGVALNSPSETAQGNWGVYDVERRLVTLGGAVMLSRGDTVITGERLELDLESGITKIDGAPANDGDDTNRVKGTFTLPEKQ